MTADMPVRWGVIGSGGIAKSFFASAASSRSGRIVAVGSRNPDPRDLSENFPEVRQIRGYDELIADPEVEAVYVATPHVLHAQWVIAAANAGKHVLCEKPMGISVKESAAMWEAARNAGTFLGEAYMYRFHPLTARIMELLRSNAIGDVRMIRSSFGFALSRVDSGHRLFASELGGGAILDVGGYPLSMACFLAGYRSDQAWLDPVELKALAHYGPTGVDEWTSAVLKFPNGIVADLSCSISVWQENILHVMGTTGRLEVDHFWFGGGKAGGTNTIRLVRPDGSRDEIPIHDHRNLYSFQFEAVNAAIRTGKNSFEYPGLDAHQSLATARLLDTWIIEASSTNHSACYA